MDFAGLQRIRVNIKKKKKKDDSYVQYIWTWKKPRFFEILLIYQAKKVNK